MTPSQTRPAGGNAALVQTWLSQHGDALWHFAVSRVGDQHAEDVLQETLLAALTAAASFQGRSSAETWLLGIMSNKVVDHFRRRARHNAQAIGEEDDGLPPAPDEFTPSDKWARKPANWNRLARNGDAPDEDPVRAAYRRCMDHLPAILKDALELRELRDLPPATVCQALGISPTNLWTRLHRARAALRRCIEDGLIAAAEAVPAPLSTRTERPR
ncbi:MAG TPA: RNA polymerase sigma factor [Phycisphaerales bacterium]|nr:RNA polymerase sigma factor [Phycisphaerales bacterium]